MNDRGGRRPGAGRPVGSKNQRSAEIARAAAEDGITPIEVMLGTMRELWAQGTPEAKREAAEIAKDAAPYTTVSNSTTTCQPCGPLVPNSGAPRAIFGRDTFVWKI